MILYRDPYEVEVTPTLNEHGEMVGVVMEDAGPFCMDDVLRMSKTELMRAREVYQELHEPDYETESNFRRYAA